MILCEPYAARVMRWDRASILSAPMRAGRGLPALCRAGIGPTRDHDQRRAAGQYRNHWAGYAGAGERMDKPCLKV